MSSSSQDVEKTADSQPASAASLVSPDEQRTVNSTPSASRNAQRYLALFVLMLQSSVLILTMRYSRMGDQDELYFGSTAVLLNELLKITICLAKSTYDVGIRATLRGVFGRDHWKLAIPAALYVIQNNLQYVAASHLEAAAFQVSYQLKILTTAFFSVAILHRSLKAQQWAALFILTLGVALVQLRDDFWTHALNLNDESSPEPEPEFRPSMRGPIIGFLAVITACFISGLAGVYFEKVLKHTEQVSLWMRNIQLSFYSLFPALLLGVIAQDGREIAAKGFFYGYKVSTVCVIILQALGGILVAIVVKYADNIMKNFATSLSIIVSAVASLLLWGTRMSYGFMVGSTLVILATFWFSRADMK